MRETYNCGYLQILKLKIYNCLYKCLMKLYSCCTWLALALHMYQVPTFCFLESPWLSLIGGIKGVQSEYLCSHCNHSPSLPAPSCNKDATARCPSSQSRFISSCSIWMQSCFTCFYVQCFSNTLQNSYWMSKWHMCLFASCDIHWSAKSFLKGPLSHSWISAPELLDPSRALPGQNLVKWDDCVESQDCF